MKFTKNHFTYISSFIFFVGYVLAIFFRNLWQPDEVRYAEISREMLERGDWVVPYLLDLRYFEKPVAGYWLNALSQLLFGYNNFSARFAATFSTAITAFFVYKITLLVLQSKYYGKISVVIFISMLLVIGTGTYSTLDPFLMLWVTAATYFFCKILYNKEAFDNADVHSQQNITQSPFIKPLLYIVVGLLGGMAFLTKGFVAVVLMGIIIGPTVLLNKLFIDFLKNLIWLIFGFCIISLPWAVSIHMKEPDYWHYFFWVEHIQRFASDDAQHKSPFWYYIALLPVSCLPWLGFLFPSIAHNIKYINKKPIISLLFSWFVISILFFSIAKGKLLTYILPCMPALAILMTCYIHQYYNLKIKQGHKPYFFQLNAILNILFGFIGIAALTITQLIDNPKFNLMEYNETYKIWLLYFIFATWSLFGFLAYRNNQKKWYLAALCPVFLSFLIDFAIPNKIINNKQPQSFIQSQKDRLENSNTIITDSIGVAPALGYELKENTVYFLSEKGELTYGLSYADSQYRYISHEDFSTWLYEKRKLGNVSLILLLSKEEENEANLVNYPEPNYVYQKNRLILLWYSQL